MKYSEHQPQTGSSRQLTLKRVCSKCGMPITKVDDSHNEQTDPKFCPHCGHKLKQIQSIFTVDDIVDVLERLNALGGAAVTRLVEAVRSSDETGKAEETGKADETGAVAAPLPLIYGKGPYKADLVSAAANPENPGGESVCKIPGLYVTEADAILAVLASAEQDGYHVDRECVRHWVTAKNEHMIDFGSHSTYGRVVSEEGSK